MTDEPAVKNDLVVRGEDGDPIADPVSVRMFEKDSYERVIEGLKIAADAAAHLVRTENEHAAYWNKQRRNLDMVRKICMQYAGLEASITFKETNEMRNTSGLSWRQGRDRFRDGIKQVAGGMRQLATCHRKDLVWAKMAADMESMSTKLAAKTVNKARQANQRGLIWLPDSVH